MNKAVHPTPSRLADENPFYISLYGFMATSLLMSLDKLGVFSYLMDQGAATAERIADVHGVNLDAMDRALHGAAFWGLVNRSGKEFSIPAQIACLLDPEAATYVGAFLSHLRTNTVPLFNHLGEAVTSGAPQWSRLLTSGDEGEHAFSKITQTDDQLNEFQAAMWSLSYRPSLELIKKGVLGDCKSIIDLGGGAGAFAIAAAESVPSITAVVFDLSALKDVCESYVRSYGVQDQVTFLAGDFWKDRLPSTDAVALGYILSDWSDDQSIDLLSRIRKSLHPLGRVIILERLLEEDKAGPFQGLMQDLAMLVETGGRHRTSEEYETLLKKSGFRHVSVVRSNSGKHAIVGLC